MKNLKLKNLKMKLKKLKKLKMMKKIEFHHDHQWIVMWMIHFRVDQMVVKIGKMKIEN